MSKSRIWCADALVLAMLFMASPLSAVSLENMPAAALREMVKKNDLPAMVEFCTRQLDGTVEEFDAAMILKTMKSGSEAGIAQAHTGLARCHLNGVGMAREDGPVVELLEKGIAGGDMAACYHLGHVHLISRNGPAAYQMMKKGAEAGVLGAQAFLAEVKLKGMGGIPKNQEEGLKELLVLAEEKNSAEAAITVANFYLTQEGRNPALFRKYIQMAADRNHPSAMVALGDMAMNNGGSKGDKQARQVAADWYRKAIARNSGDGMLRLGLLQMRDTLLRKPGEDWYELLLQADRVGSGEATLKLAEIHYHAPGYTFRDLDWTKSAYYHEKFIREGRGETDFHVSLHMLFDMYYEGGHGLDRDYKKCLELASKYMDRCHMASWCAGRILLHPDAPMGKTREHFIRGYACLLKHRAMEGRRSDEAYFVMRSRHGMTKEEIERAEQLFREGFPNSQTPILP